SALQNAASIA
nr:Chain I, mycobacterial hsp60 decameric epitope [synthetic construct]1N3N_J Chain J, mycobacterial hsp60 decameric epitope [synthetic construct]1N3N_K Chain K, mycobacterial hsp60 decameric epitope [synthetic construct]1N3N_L Chain L, mycobacterial hsp60 decameric epitope [synthetic construct]